MEQSPTGPLPFDPSSDPSFGPPSGPAAWPAPGPRPFGDDLFATGRFDIDSRSDVSATDVDSTGPDRTDPQPDGAVHHRGRRLLPRFIGEEAFQTLRGHLASVGLALALAIPAACAVFFGLGALRFALDDRTLWDSVAHSIVQFWYMLVAFVLVAFPPALIAVRRGGHEAAEFIGARGYWKALLIAYVIIPAVAAIVAFVVGHILIVLLILVVVIVIIAHSGGF
ncbi:MAG: hypothetical protein JWN39_1148 [Ilumatobacteraceae bacterium]|nr:hypothetical protein [Ilumatobacteraceae bacterium]